jgi:CheY-like chemotaxis protein
MPSPTDEPLPPILVIDDDTDDTYFLLHRLEEAGVRNPVLTFTNGADAIEFLAALPGKADPKPSPCLVFVDARMPGMSGFNVLAWLRNHGPLAKVPVFLLSGSDNPQDIEQAFALGADHFLPKHPVPEVLARTIRPISGIRFN